MAVVVLAVVAASCSAATESPESPMGVVMTPEVQEKSVELATSGAMDNVSEGAKIRAVSGNFNEALGYYPTEEDITKIKAFALYIDQQVSAGAGCYQLDTAIDDIATALQTDRGRAEYIMAAAIMAWASPETNAKIFSCFS